MPQFTDANVQRQYNDILNQLGANSGYTPVSMPEQSLDSITAQLAAAYRPQYEAAIAQRYGATKKQKAAIDVDAASRGMGTSTWVTDAKNRIMNAEAADIAGLEGDYASKLAGDAMDRYTDYLNDRLKLDQYNQQLALQLEGNAYDRAMDQYNSGMIEGTLPYQQLIFNWQQTQNAAKGGSGGSGGSRNSTNASKYTLEEANADAEKEADEIIGSIPKITSDAYKSAMKGFDFVKNPITIRTRRLGLDR